MATLDFLSGQVLRSTAGAIYTGAKASYWSDAGATTPLTTYSDAGLSSANTNPVVADGTTGAFGAIYLQAKRYWRTVTTSAGVSLPQFNLGPIDAGMTLVTSATSPSPTYPLLWWYDTTSGNLKRRNAADSAWLDFGGIDSLLNSASVTEQLAGTATDKSSTPDSVAALWQRGTDIASAGTLSLPSTGGGVFNVTGTTTITGISSASGGRGVWLKFAGALTFTHNGTSLILPGATNITTVAGDMAYMVNEAAADGTGSNWRCFAYVRSSGSPLNITDQLGSQSDAETNTSTTKTLSIANLKYHPAMCKVWANVTYSAGTPTLNDQLNMTSITDTATGRLTFTIATDFNNATWSYSCSSAAPSAGSEVITNVRQGTQTAGVIEITTQSTGGVDTDAESICLQGWGDFA